ncbi:MAG: sialidase family protein [Candidatus Hodarchaeales archaeon]|jgi:hypothetical protein
MKNFTINFFLVIFLLISIFSLAISDNGVNAINAINKEKFNQRISINNEIIGFSENIILSITDQYYSQHVEPTLAISTNDTLFVGWKNAETHNSGGVRVSFSKSVDNGQTWLYPFNMPHFENLPSRQSDPWMVWFNDTLFYAYLEFGNFSQISIASTSDYGISWYIANASSNNYFADKETITVSSDGVIYLVYDDVMIEGSDEGPAYVRLSYSIDNGITFQDQIILSDNDMFEGVAPYIVTNKQGDIYIAWFKYNSETDLGNIYLDSASKDNLLFSLDRQITFTNGSSFTVTPDGRPAKITLPVLKFDQNDRLYLLWSDISEPEGSWDVYIKYSDDYGFTWSEKHQVNPETDGHQWMADMDIDYNGRVHIVWLDEQNFFYKPYYRSISFETEIPVFSETLSVADMYTSSTFTRPGDYITLRVDSKSIPHIVWTDGRWSELDIYYSHGIMNETKSLTASTETFTSTDVTNTTIEETSSASTSLNWISIVLVSIPIYLIKKKRK